MIVAPPFDNGSSQSTVTSVDELAVRVAFRGADATAAETDCADPPEADGVTEGASSLAVPAPALFTARMRITYVVPLVSAETVSGDAVEPRAVHVEPALIENW